MELTAEQQRALVGAACSTDCYPHPVDHVELIETHISYVLLAGDYAYKIKKPLNLGFLDFRSLERRAFFCAEEVRLNRRLAPDIYLRRIPITGSPEAPRMEGEGEAIEYAVLMRRFPQQALLPELAAAGGLSPELVDRIARAMADFHAEAERADADSPYSQPHGIARLARDNLRVLTELHPGLPALPRLSQWTEAELGRLDDVFRGRLAQGRVVEGHGDLHLANMAFADGRLIIFDGIEFDPELRWLDTMSELAFTVMDLDRRGFGEHANRLANGYLERSGDYGGLRVLPFYLVYRALVRAKIVALRADQLAGESESEAHQQAVEELHAHLLLAERYTRQASPKLVLTHGFSGSGKSTAAQWLVDHRRYVRLRSDVERKRLQGLTPEDNSGSALETGLYTPEMTAATYRRLQELAEQVLSNGFSVVVDAAFLKAEQRAEFRELAQRLEVPLLILRLEAPVPELECRLHERAHRGADPSEATVEVLTHQLKHSDPLSEEELRLSQRLVMNEEWESGLAGLFDADAS